MRNDIAFTMVVRNAAPFLPDVLGTALSLFNEVVIGYDASSTDDTLKVLLDILGFETRANVVAFRNVEFAMEAHNRVQELVRSPWTFMLDADELISPTLYTFLESFKLPDDDDRISTFLITRENTIAGQIPLIRSSEVHYRLFRSRMRYISQKHQFIQVDAEEVASIDPPAVIWHYKTAKRHRQSDARISTYPDKWRGTHAGEPVFLMIGEGKDNPDGSFVVVSPDPNSGADLCWDFSLPLPWTEDSVEGIIVGDVIGMLSPMQLEFSVMDWYRVLKPGCAIIFRYSSLSCHIRKTLDSCGCLDVLLGHTGAEGLVSITARKGL